MYRGFARHRNGDYALAIADYDSALEISEEPYAYYGRSLAYGKLGNRVEAAGDLAKARVIGYDQVLADGVFRD